MLRGGIVGGLYGKGSRDGGGGRAVKSEAMFYAEYTAVNITATTSSTNVAVSDVIAFNAEVVSHGESDRKIAFNDKTGTWEASEKCLHQFIVSVHSMIGRGNPQRAKLHIEYQKNEDAWLDMSSDSYLRRDQNNALTPYTHGEEPILLDTGDTIRFRARRTGETSLAVTYNEIRAKVVEQPLRTAA